MRPLVAALLLCLGLEAHAEEWPLLGNKFKGHDCYNLGLLGAKASDAGMPPADDPDDLGPRRLRIRVLFPNGPAAKAGLRVGDVVVGVNGRRFGGGSLAPLSEALRKAESKSGAVTLTVEPRRKIKVKIPRGGHRAIVDKALQWLAARQEANGRFVLPRDQRTATVVVTSLAGLAWLGAGSDLGQGRYRNNVRRAADLVTRNVPRLDSNEARAKELSTWRYSNWGLAHAAIFLGELHARTPDKGVSEALRYCADRLVGRQWDSGAWSHGPAHPDNHAHNIVTGFALCGLGLAHQNGYPVPKTTVEKAQAYLKKTAGRPGAIAYSHDPDWIGQGNVTRTAACWLGYLSLGEAKRPWGKAMGDYIDGRLGEEPPKQRHVQHILLAGLAAHAREGRARKSFWKWTGRDLILARAPDGSFQPRTLPGDLATGSIDVELGEVWTTASWTIVLAAREGKPGYPAWFDRR